MFSSDFDKKKYLNIVSINEIKKLFEEASSDYVDYLDGHRDSKTNEWILKGYRQKHSL